MTSHVSTVASDRHVGKPQGETVKMDRNWARQSGLACAVITTLVFALAPPALADEFEKKLARIDRALASNPNHVVEHALTTCVNRRAFAANLYYAGHVARAERSLNYCIKLLRISERDPNPRVDPSKMRADARAKALAKATRELDRALTLKPNLRNGLEIYRGCAACHTPEGWGLASGVVPQLAGQHRNVIIKQLADIRMGNRANRLMLPYSSVEAIGGPQAVADVAGYIDTLEISVQNGKGPGKDLDLGAKLYAENCVRCHGAEGEGDNDTFRPRIQAQHYDYLVTQFKQIKDGTRQNADPEMAKQIANFKERETHAVLDYVSRLQPAEELQAPPGWRNPDFDDPVLISQDQ
jgi:cytochrome c553